jgi:serine phosphatase RsbU (regulator of sigma subunit)/CBS domain-containing protein
MPATELTVRQMMMPEPAVLPPDTPVQDALDLMNKRRIGSVLVCDGTGSLVGIFTERDLLKRVVTAIPGWREYPISSWMTPNPHTIGQDVGWNDAVAAMQKLRVRHLPVIEAGRLVGILSPRGLMAKRTEYLDRQVEQRTTDLRRANDELLARDAEITRTLRAAGRLQKQLLLPKAPPAAAGLDWAVHYAPLDHLGGDYYDFADPGPGKVGVFIADAAGHSVAAAMVAVMARIAFADVAARTASPGDVLTEVNRRLQGLADERFVSAFYGVLDLDARTFHYAAAGHPYPHWVCGRTNQVKPLCAPGFLLGILPDEEYRERTIELSPGDRLFLYTDGLVEARNEIGEMFGADRLAGCLSTHGRGPVGTVLESVLACQRSFCGSQRLTDDLTVVVLGVE